MVRVRDGNAPHVSSLFNRLFWRTARAIETAASTLQFALVNFHLLINYFSQTIFVLQEELK